MSTTTSDLTAFLASHRPLNDGATWKAGDVVEGWRVTAFLGRGGSGEVYRVKQVGTGRAAALKVLRLKADASEERRTTAQARFLREADFLVRNDSPFCPKAFAVGEAEGRPYVVMELLDAKPLPRRDGAVASFLLAVCRAVRTLHRRGFVHRDIKPANILWRANGDLVLSDLGLLKGSAPTAGHTGVTATLVEGRVVGAGTPHYAAPEQFDGGSISDATDIHALGVLIDDCFGGKPPRDWARIVRRATSSLPERRYRDVEDLMRAIRWRHAGRVFMLGGALLVAGLAVWWGAVRSCRATRRRCAACWLRRTKRTRCCVGRRFARTSRRMAVPLRDSAWTAPRRRSGARSSCLPIATGGLSGRGRWTRRCRARTRGVAHVCVSTTACCSTGRGAVRARLRCDTSFVRGRISTSSTRTKRMTCGGGVRSSACRRASTGRSTPLNSVALRRCGICERNGKQRRITWRIEPKFGSWMTRIAV